MCTLCPICLTKKVHIFCDCIIGVIGYSFSTLGPCTRASQDRLMQIKWQGPVHLVFFKKKSYCPIRFYYWDDLVCCILFFRNLLAYCSWWRRSWSKNLYKVKSVNIQYNTLGCRVDGTNDSSTKCLMFHALFFFHNFL